MDWVIKPYVGVGDLKFGMDAASVEALLGPSRDSDIRGDWTRYEFRALKDPMMAYDDRGLGEINFDRHFGSGLTLESHDIFTGDPGRFLKLVSAADPGLVKFLDTIVSYKFGLSFGGFCADEDPKTRSLSVFRKGVWDDDRLRPGVPVSFT